MKATPILITLLLAILALLSNRSITSTSDAYTSYLEKFNKPLPSLAQRLYRQKIFEAFLQKMEKHNADPTKTWKMGVNQFSDLTEKQFMNTYLGEMKSEVKQIQQEQVNAGFAGTIDWRNKGIVTDVKNQGKCGSCWAFAATAAHQSYQIQHHRQPRTIDLSEQQLVDCSTAEPYANHGCNGGFGVRALEYIKDFGQTTTAQYPYAAVNQDCKTPKGKYKPFGVAEGAGCGEMDEIIQRRPMAVRVDASNWHSYASGVFDNCGTNLNHAVFLIGSSSEAWTIKNSWTPSWGEDGFIRLKKGNTCGVCTGPSFPL